MLARLLDRYHRWLVLGLLCLLPALAWSAAWKKSPTSDEPYHIAVGYAAWVEGVQKWDLIHPSLSRRWVALPLLFLRPDLPTGLTTLHDFSHAFLFGPSLSPQIMLRCARAMTLLPALWLAGGVYLWSKELFGPRAGLLSLACVVLDPNVLAHSGLATTDIPLTAAFFWTVYLFWRLCRRPRPGSAVWAGAALGAALATKHSALVLLPMLAFLLIVGGLGQNRRRRLYAGLAACALAVVVVFVESGLEWISVSEFLNEQSALHGQPLGDAWPVWATVRMPLVRYLYGITIVVASHGLGRSAFFLGQVLTGGTPVYFPVVFLLKTSLPVMGLLLWALIAGGQYVVRSVRAKSEWQWREALFLALPPVLYAYLAVAGRLNLGYRHLLPVLPLLYVGVGQLARIARTRLSQVAIGLLVVWLVVESLVVFPHYLAYFTLAVGGPSAGYRYLVDSNLDWGQELISLAEYQAAHQTGPIHLGYFGRADPAYYGVKYHCLPSWGVLDCPDASLPREGWVAVSATCLQGLCEGVSDFYAPLRDRKPEAVLGHSMFLYRLE